MLLRKNNFPWLMLLLILAIIPYAFYNNLNSPYLNYNYYKFKTLLTVNSNLFFGSFNFFCVPIDIIIWILSQLFQNKTILLFHILFIYIGAIGIFYLILYFKIDKKTAFLTSLFYIYWIYGQFVSFWHPINILFGLLPFLVIIFLRINKNNSLLINSIYFSLIFFLLTGINATFLVYIYIFIFIYNVILFFTNKKKGVYFFKFLILSGFFSFFLTIFYYGTICYYLLHDSRLFTGSLSLETVDWKSSTSWLHEIYREMGCLNYYYIFNGFYSYPNAQLFINNKIFILISYLPITCFALYSLLLKKNIKQIYLDLLLIFLFFMSMGTFVFSPTKYLYKYLANHIPFFSIFRDSYKPMLFIHLIYTIDIGFIFNWLYKKSKRFYNIFYFLFLICIFTISYQFWSGRFLKYEQINIPNSWRKLVQNHYIKNDALTLLVPNLPFQVYKYTTLRGKNTTFFRPYFQNNVIYEQGGSIYYFDPYPVTYLYKLLYRNYKLFPEAAGFLGIQYILNQYSADYKLYDHRYSSTNHITLSPKEIEIKLKKYNKIKFVKKINDLALYQIEPTIISKKIYIAKKIFLNFKNSVTYPMLIENFLKYGSIGFITSNNNLNLNKLYFNFTNIDFIDIYNIGYLINIDKYKNTILLVLNKNYDPNWSLYKIKKKLSFLKILILPLIKSDIKEHLVINKYSNGWILKGHNKKEKFLLIYKPQIVFYLFLIISLVTLIILIIILISWWINENKNKKLSLQ